jgi:Bacterial PH domain
MKVQQNEVTLASRRLHWGIWIVPLQLLILLSLMALPFVLVLHMMHRAMAQISPNATNPFEVLLFVFLLFPVAVVILPLIVAIWIAYLKSEIILTSQRLIYRAGLVARVSGELPLGNIEAIILTEPILGRLFGYGTVMVTTLGGLRLPFRFIGMAPEFHATLQTAVQIAKTKSTTIADSRTPNPSDDSRYMPKG